MESKKGRPIQGDEKSKIYTISQTPTEREKLKEIGNGSPSSGMRFLLDLYTKFITKVNKTI